MKKQIKDKQRMHYNLSKKDAKIICDRYENLYQGYGYSPRTLDWDKGKQDMRFSILTSQFNFQNTEVLDIGCGFGDLNRILSARTDNQYKYHGVDIVPSFISEARRQYNSDKVNFYCGDFLAMDLPEVDYAIASGIFNFKLKDSDNYNFIEQTMKKAFSLSRVGFAFDFLSDKVDYGKEMTFHSSPEKILAFAYGLSRNVSLLNNYMPFEFSVFVFKDDSFDPKYTIFNRWFESNPGVDKELL
ncbi:MAG: class I SAM-dependent methyltransferase [Proteobacteria bacterium]|nr:class I SAM-dependent methyltransferase [Pseudomonadota bacterium]MBU1582679.1 class I SAM-dependent methyltransferase [Pseudomonadota bacterium]MBU2631467.1 class I SAM-dependent methyltransferase [Pseudomonadota bacterium]